MWLEVISPDCKELKFCLRSPLTGFNFCAPKNYAREFMIYFVKDTFSTTRAFWKIREKMLQRTTVVRCVLA